MQLRSTDIDLDQTVHCHAVDFELVLNNALLSSINSFDPPENRAEKILKTVLVNMKFVQLHFV